MVIPFGGGSSISGSLQAESGETRPVISIDMGRLNRVLWVDATSQLACVQAGVFGPDLERSSSAGLDAAATSPTASRTRRWAAGSLRAPRVCSPTATAMSPSSRAGCGWSPRRACSSCDRCRARRPARACARWCWAARVGWGSSPRRRSTSAACRPSAGSSATCSPTWAAGLAAMRDLAASEASPSVTRVSDAHESAFSFAMRNAPTPLDRLKSKALQAFLRRKGWDLEAMCLSFIGYEGTRPPRGGPAQARRADRQAPRRAVHRQSPGELYDQKKFDTPYIRDFLLDRGAPADVSETSAPWSELQRGLRQRDGGRSRRLRPAWRTRLSDVPPVALLPRGCLPLLHLRAQPAGSETPWRTTAW